MALRLTMGIFSTAAIAAHLAQPSPAHADVFGCKVLLCIMSPTGWSNVAACVPPVDKAFAMVAEGKPWPTCAEAGQRGGINYSPYLPCPSGTPSNGPDDADGGLAQGAGAYCRVAKRAAGTASTAKDWGADVRYDYVPRPPRAQPYYVRLQKPGKAPELIWFSFKR